MTYQIGDRIRDRENHRLTGVVARQQASETAVIVSWDDPKTPENPYAVPVWLIELIPPRPTRGRKRMIRG